MIKYFLIFLYSLSLFGDSKIISAFTDGYAEAEVKLFYYDSHKESTPDSYATSLGGYLKYTTDSKNPFFASLRFHTSNPVGNTLNPELTSLFNNDNNASALNVVSESFLAYQAKNRIMRVGNFMLKTPMMNVDTTRTVPWSYQGFTYTGTAIKDTKVQLNYISAIRSHTSDAYTDESASGRIGKSGITMLALHYSGIKGLSLKGYYYYAPELYSTFIAKAYYQFYADKETLLCLGAQYFNSGNGGEFAQTESRNGGDDINLLALRVLLDREDYSISLNYSNNFGISGIVKGYGGLAKVYTTSMVANGRGNYKPETWMLKSSYRLPLNTFESEVALTLTKTEVNDPRGDPFNAYYLHFKHYFNKETSIYLRYESIDFLNDKSDASYFRAIASYRFLAI